MEYEEYIEQQLERERDLAKRMDEHFAPSEGFK